MYKIVFKTALKTFAILLALSVVAFTVASLGFPQHMATFFEKTGNFSFATGYASLAYTYSNSFDDLARCADDSILSKDDRNIVNFAGKMTSMEYEKQFEEYCKKRDAGIAENFSGVSDAGFGYRRYILGNLACAQYSLGNRSAALATAEKTTEEGGFPRNNAYAMLARRAFEKHDGAMKAELKRIVEGLSGDGEDEEEYRQTVLELLKL